MNDNIIDIMDKLDKNECIAMGILSIYSKQSKSNYITSYELTDKYFEILKTVKENFSLEKGEKDG